jgi:predicted Zn-dependent protease
MRPRNQVPAWQFMLVGSAAVLFCAAQAIAQARPTPAKTQSPRSLELQVSARGRPSDAQQLEIAEALLAERGQEPQALEEAGRRVAAVLERTPDSTRALLLAGRIAMKQGQPAVAASHYRAVTQKASPPRSAWLGLGQSLDATGDVAGATEAYARYRASRGLRPLPPETSASAPPQ